MEEILGHFIQEFLTMQTNYLKKISNTQKGLKGVYITQISALQQFMHSAHMRTFFVFTPYHCTFPLHTQL